MQLNHDILNNFHFFAELLGCLRVKYQLNNFEQWTSPLKQFLDNGNPTGKIFLYLCFHGMKETNHKTDIKGY